MVQTMPAVRGHTSEGQARAVPFVFAAASLVGGGAMAALIGLLGSVLGPHALGAILFPFLTILALGELGVIRVPRPQRKEQVPANWRSELPPSQFAAGYGFLLGGGVFTPIPHLTFYLVVLLAAFVGPIAAALVGISYAGARAAAIIAVVLMAGSRDPVVVTLDVGYLGKKVRRANATYLALAAIAAGGAFYL